MGVEVKGAGDGVVIADRGCNDCYNRNSGWGSGWGAVGGALVGGGFGAAAVSVWDKINDTKADIQKVESTVQEAKAGIYKDISDAARGVTQEISGVAKDVAGVGREILNNRSESPRNPAPDFEEFKLFMNERLTNQETLLLRIAQELGLDKPKQ